MNKQEIALALEYYLNCCKPVLLIIAVAFVVSTESEDTWNEIEFCEIKFCEILSTEYHLFWYTCNYVPVMSRTAYSS